MNNQEVFNKVLTHLRKQGKPAFNTETDECMYRGPDNTKCAIGCLIPDEEYKEVFEGLNVQCIMNRYTLESLKDTNLTFLARLQRHLHDDPAFSSFGNKTFLAKLEVAAQNIAYDYQLTIP